MRDLSFEKDSYEIYSAARQRLIADPSPLIAVEEGVTSLVSGLLKAASNEIQEDYDVVWAAAGHPHAVYPTTYDELIQCTGATPMVVGE
jgi:hypothetical protein